MAVIVEPVLTEEKLLALLAERNEQSCLDYKETVDLTERRDTVEIAKDVAAMQSEPSGGYLVIGADSSGTVVPGSMTSQLADLFDEARLRAKLKNYLLEPFTISTAVHTINGDIFVLVYIGPSEHGWCIFAANGEYEDATKKPPKVILFRKGDVFVRHGSASERWQDTDRERLIKQIIERRKEAWRTELRQELAAIGERSLTASRLEELPASALTWKLDAEGFDQLVTELMRRNDDIPLRQLLTKIPADADSLQDNPQEISTLLDRLTSVGGLALQFERHHWLDKVLTAFVTIYETRIGAGNSRYPPSETASFWLDIIAHVYALGGLAVRLKEWSSVRTLANRRPRGETFGHYGSWLRHAQTMASRANVIDTDESAGLIARARNVVRSVAATRPDITAEDDAILDGLCQFDALGGLVVIGERKSFDSGNYYPSFSRYFTQRTAPAFIGIVTDPQMRSALFNEDDQFLADGLSEVLSRAEKESFAYDGWDRMSDGPVSRFIDEHRTRPE
jgi:hypothetical protein